MPAVVDTVNNGEDLASFGGLPLTVESQVMCKQSMVNARIKNIIVVGKYKIIGGDVCILKFHRISRYQSCYPDQ